jgi:hypothetical protein
MATQSRLPSVYYREKLIPLYLSQRRLLCLVYDRKQPWLLSVYHTAELSLFTTRQRRFRSVYHGSELTLLFIEVHSWLCSVFHSAEHMSLCTPQCTADTLLFLPEPRVVLFCWSQTRFDPALLFTLICSSALLILIRPDYCNKLKIYTVYILDVLSEKKKTKNLTRLAQ